MDIEEYAIAKVLMKAKLYGYEIPGELPASLIPHRFASSSLNNLRESRRVSSANLPNTAWFNQSVNKSMENSIIPPRGVLQSGSKRRYNFGIQGIQIGRNPRYHIFVDEGLEKDGLAEIVFIENQFILRNVSATVVLDSGQLLVGQVKLQEGMSFKVGALSIVVKELQIRGNLEFHPPSLFC